MRTIILILLLTLLFALPVQAATVSVYVTCATLPDEDNARVVWFGYSSSDTLDNSGFGYIGNAAFGGDVQAGDYPRFAEFHVSAGETVLFWAEGFAAGEHVYSEAWYRAGDVVPLCEDSRDTPEAPVLDDQGVVNDPTVNARANACYSGLTCTNDAEWARGWYLIRQQYGLI